jgi:hypothetical protein
MPAEDLYTPSMSCRVFDKIFKGLDGALLGVFNIPMGQIMRDLRGKRYHLVNDLKYICEQLEAAIKDEAILTYKSETSHSLVDTKDFRKEQKEAKKVYQEEEPVV